LTPYASHWVFNDSYWILMVTVTPVLNQVLTQKLILLRLKL
jgi:hypothetical protein